MQFIIGSNYPKIVIPLIDACKTNLDVLMYQWCYYSYNGKTSQQRLNFAIKGAIIRRVPTRVILHPGSASGTIGINNSQIAHFLKLWGAQVKFGLRGGILHAKMLLLDKTIAIIGSHNFSKRAMTSNTEISAVCEGAGEIRPLVEYFNILWSQN